MRINAEPSQTLYVYCNHFRGTHYEIDYFDIYNQNAWGTIILNCFQQQEYFQIIISEVTNGLIKQMALFWENRKIVCLPYRNDESAPTNSNFRARVKVTKIFVSASEIKVTNSTYYVANILLGLIHLWTSLMTLACKELVTMV